ncbi:MAG: T9SS type A sorting domain-containing protein [Ginsengibacter sp.]
MKKSLILFIFYTLFTSLSLLALPKLSSLPTAPATIFLDFDGHFVTSTLWNGGNSIDCASSGMNDAQITEIFNRVSEDYRPFNVNITTDSAVFLAAPLTKRIRMIITTSSAWYPGVGGVAFVGSFTWGDDTPAFVFTNRLGPFNTKIVAECCSHESGHTVGLSHQSKYNDNCALTATYNDGIGTGETGWAPIMGNSYYKNHTGWNNGPTPGGCNSLQDNLTIITTKNGFTYRTDDHSDDPGINPTLMVIANKSFSNSGIITTTSDKDVFQLDISQTGTVHLNALPFSVGADDNGADLDIKITLLNALMQPINVYNPADLLDAAFDTILTSGRYYVMLDGTGNNFSTDYGSLGSYTISGTFTAINLLPVTDIALNGKIDDNKHNLSWNIISGEPVKSLDIESSTDGTRFKSVTNLSAKVNKFTYDPFIKIEIFYRLRVTSIKGEVVYSNIIALKSGGNTEKSFTVSTMVHDEILVNASKDYTYMLLDGNGRAIAKGSNRAGIQRININNHPKGIYVMQIISQNERVTERIIRQ